MYSTATNKEKVIALADFHSVLFQKIVRDLRNEHIKKDPLFQKKYFPGTQAAKLTPQELIPGYSKAIQEEENGEAIAEHLLQRWMLKEPELYDFFEKKLSEISTDFTALTALDKEVEEKLVKEAEKQFGALSTYLFAVINSVCFSETTFSQLRNRAKVEMASREQNQEQEAQLQNEQKSLSALTSQIARLQDKYEKKFQALERKYFVDTDSLKKQIAKLQTRLSHVEKNG